MKPLPKDVEKTTDQILKKIMPKVREALLERNKKHGTVPFVNFHEAYGVCAEELHEVMDSIWKHHTKEDVAKEFLDLAIASFHAYYSFHEDLNEVLEAEAIWLGKLGKKVRVE